MSYMPRCFWDFGVDSWSACNAPCSGHLRASKIFVMVLVVSNMPISWSSPKKSNGPSYIVLCKQQTFVVGGSKPLEHIAIPVDEKYKYVNKTTLNCHFSKYKQRTCQISILSHHRALCLKSWATVAAASALADAIEVESHKAPEQTTGAWWGSWSFEKTARGRADWGICSKYILGKNWLTIWWPMENHTFSGQLYVIIWYTKYIYTIYRGWSFFAPVLKKILKPPSRFRSRAAEHPMHMRKFGRFRSLHKPDQSHIRGPVGWRRDSAIERNRILLFRPWCFCRGWALQRPLPGFSKCCTSTASVPTPSGHQGQEFLCPGWWFQQFWRQANVFPRSWDADQLLQASLISLYLELDSLLMTTRLSQTARFSSRNPGIFHTIHIKMVVSMFDYPRVSFDETWGSSTLA